MAELYRLALPYQVVHSHGGPTWAPRVDQVQLVTMAYHIVVLSVSWAFALIRFDGERLPIKLVAFGLAVAILPILAYPMSMCVPWQATTAPTRWPEGMYLDATMRVVTALAAAVFFGRILSRGLCPTADPKLDPLGAGTAKLVDLIVIVLLPVMVIGWQSSPGLLVIAALLSRTLPLKTKVPENGVRHPSMLGRFAVAVPVALTVHLVLWRLLHYSGYWPAHGQSPWLFLIASALVLLASYWLRDRKVAESSLVTPVASGVVSDVANDFTNADDGDDLVSCDADADDDASDDPESELADP